MDSPGQAARDPKSARGADVYLLLALVLSLIAATPLLIGPGIVNTRAGGDSPFLLQRVHQVVANLRAGVVPARWMPDGAYGLGYPAFIYYAALPYYVASLLDLAGTGILWGIKLTQLLGFALAASGTYVLARSLGAGRVGALLASAAYSFAPYHLVNVYVRGDALSEFYAMGLFPLVLWSLTRLRRRIAPQDLSLVAVTYAALILTHNVSALVFTPVVVLWLVVQASMRRGQRGWRMLGFGAIGLGLGLLLSLWFWGPALAEQSLVQLSEQTTGFFHYGGHFRGTNMIQPRLLHDYVIDGARDPYNTGLLQALLGVTGLVTLAIRRLRGQRNDTLLHLCALVVLACTLLITPISRWVWDHAPLLAYTQFPWRLLGVQALMIALVSIHVPNLAKGRARVVLGTMCILLLALAGMARLSPDRLQVTDGDVTPKRLMLYETFSRNIGGTVRHEYLPAEMVPRPYVSGVQLNGGIKPPPLVLDGEMSYAALSQRTPEREDWQVQIQEPSHLAFHTTYLSGWQATVDGQPHQLEAIPGLGLVGLKLPPGHHDVSLRFGHTPVRRMATWGSLVAALVCLGLLLAPCRGSPRARQAWVLASLVMLLVLGWLAVAPERSASASTEGPLVMDFRRAPYLHREPKGVVFSSSPGDGGSASWLLSYEMSGTALRPGEDLRVTTQWQSPHPSRHAVLKLKGVTSHYFGQAPVWAEASVSLADATASATLPLPADIAPGLYVVTCQVYDGEEEMVPRTSAGVEMSRLTFQPVQVLGRRNASGLEETLASYGPEREPAVISLVAVEARRFRRDRIEIALTWCSERQARLNYLVAVRLADADGDRIAERDIPPLLGGYPTSLWRPGELVGDRVRMKIPADAELLGGHLEVILYDGETLAAAGSARVPLESTVLLTDR